MLGIRFVLICCINVVIYGEIALFFGFRRDGDWGYGFGFWGVVRGVLSKGRGRMMSGGIRFLSMGGVWNTYGAGAKMEC